MNSIAKRIASWAPAALQQRAKELMFARQVRRREFRSDEPEWAFLADWVREGDFVLDIGANVGHYTLELARLVGPKGRVVAFEPIKETFDLLAANVRVAGFVERVHLFNCAVSDAGKLVRMGVPKGENGLANYYRARIGGSGRVVSAVRVDDGEFRGRISLIKIDVEGHEFEVVSGAMGTIGRDKPTMLVEGTDSRVEAMLMAKGYQAVRLPYSPNTVFYWGG